MAKRIDVPSSINSNAYSYMNWNKITSTSSKQYQLIREYGRNYDEKGFGRVNGRYVVAMTAKFGEAGDYVDIYMTDGQVINAVLGDIKRYTDKNSHPDGWGHIYNNQVSVIEMITNWVTENGPSGWKDMFNRAGVKYVINQGSCLGGATPSAAKPIDNIGQKIVDIARKQVGKPYDSWRSGTETDMTSVDKEPESFRDTESLVYYAYNKAGKSISYATLRDVGSSNMDKYKHIHNINDLRAGDLLYYDLGSGIYIGNSGTLIDTVAIATERGGMIYVSREEGKVVEVNSIDVGLYRRILADTEATLISETSLGVGGPEEDPAPGTTAYDYISLTAIDPLSQSIAKNLSRMSPVKSMKDSYGYLIDLDHGGEFKFYIPPEFSEQAGANWSDVELRGRSVSVKAYENTTSRSISISLDLYAGVGVYEPTSVESGEDTVSRLHKDANFVKSLEYPDYSNIIVTPPPTVQLILGSAINLVGVASGISVTHMRPLDLELRAMHLRLNFTVTQTAVNPPDYSDIRAGQYQILDTASAESMSKGVAGSNVLLSTLKEG